MVPRSSQKAPPPRNLQQTYADGPAAVLRRGAFSYERGTPVSKRRAVDESEGVPDVLAKGEEIVMFNCLDLYHKSPSSDERQCKSRTVNRRFDLI